MRLYIPLDTKICHLRDILLSQSFSTVVKKYKLNTSKTEQYYNIE